MAEGLHHYQCDKQHEHVHLEGKIPGTNIARTSFAENYGTMLAQNPSDLLDLSHPHTPVTDTLMLRLEEGEDSLYIYIADNDTSSKEMYHSDVTFKEESSRTEHAAGRRCKACRRRLSARDAVRCRSCGVLLCNQPPCLWAWDCCFECNQAWHGMSDETVGDP